MAHKERKRKKTMSAPTPEWFKHAVIYQIYPQSFCDSNGDGIGDLQGIISKLDYIQGLGVNTLWLNPIFDSPFGDAGYDVRDYRKVAERYGTLDDLKQLFNELHKRGMHILLDLVPGHTSIEHPWFKAAVSAEKTPYDNYYMFTDGEDDDQRGYRFISGYGPHNGFFMTNFFYFQPALNYGFTECAEGCKWQLPIEHPDVQKVREEIRNVIKYWLDMGCDGFRVDMAASLVRGKERLEGVTALWRDYSKWVRENYPNAILLSEWGYPTESINAGFDADFFLSMAGLNVIDMRKGYKELFRWEKYVSNTLELQPDSPRSFFCKESSGNTRSFSNELEDHTKNTKGRGFFSIVTGNHDAHRIRKGRSLEDLKVAYTAIFSLPGVPLIYYGDEIGMQYLPQVGNVEGSYHRGGSRTPMQWTADEKAGFSTAPLEKFYTMLDPDPNRPNVETQSAQPDSLLNYTKSLLKLRSAHFALSTEGEYRPVVSEKSDAPWIYERIGNGERFLITLNPADKARRIELPGRISLEKLIGCGETSIEQNGCVTTLVLGPVSAAILKEN